MEIGRLDHVGIAVADLAAARALYEGMLGLEVTHEEVIAEQGVHELLLRAGEAYVQLVAPQAPGSPDGRFLAKRGEGMHHVGYAVPDVAAALANLRALGFEVIEPAPRIGSGGTTTQLCHFAVQRTTQGRGAGRRMLELARGLVPAGRPLWLFTAAGGSADRAAAGAGWALDHTATDWILELDA